MKPKVIILKGLPASGKTTWAKEQVKNGNGQVKRVNKDDLRAMLDEGKWSKEREKFILFMRNEFISRSLVNGFTIIVDDTNLAPKHIEEISEQVDKLSKLLGWTIEIEINDSFCAVPMRECIRRDALRPNPVGRDVIRRMALQFGVGQPEPYYIEGLPECVICDLDGTLALIGKRNPYDASTCDQDKLNGPVARYLKTCARDGMPIFLFSGREEKYREQTRQWLKYYEIPFHWLAMRPTGNSEKDVIIKRGMFEEYIRGDFNVHVVFDDRQCVVDAWRDLGLMVFQVAEGDF